MTNHSPKPLPLWVSTRLIDPYDFYRNRTAELQSQATGVESLLYKVFGPDLIASIAFRIDPYRKFRRIPSQKDPVIRKRFKRRAPILRSHYYRKRNLTRVNYYIGNGKYGDLVGNWYQIYDGGGALPPQEFIDQFSYDTVKRTRLPGVPGGPFEKFEYSISNSTYNRLNTQYSINTYPDGQASDSRTEDQYWIYGSPALMEKSDISLLLANEQSLALSSLNKYILPMYRRAMPTTKLFDISRSIGELRDLGVLHNLANLPEYVGQLKSRTRALADAPNDYLTGVFGLQPLVQDILSLMSLPARLSKRVNYLLERNGKPTSWRTKFKLNLPLSNPPSFSFVSDGLSFSNDISTSATREAEVRLAVNATVEFPNINDPDFNHELYMKLAGATPDAMTLYNLTPWTWLIDWFTGFNEYLDIITRINTDSTLVNYGYATYKSKVRIVSQYTSKTNENTSIWYRPSAAVSYNSVKRYNASASLDFTYQKRVEVSQLGASTVVDRANLSPFQLTIISALFGQRISK